MRECTRVDLYTIGLTKLIAQMFTELNNRVDLNDNGGNDEIR